MNAVASVNTINPSAAQWVKKPSTTARPPRNLIVNPIQTSRAGIPCEAV